MTQALKRRGTAMPTVEKLAVAWQPVYNILGFGKVETEVDYDRAVSIMDDIVDEIGDNEKHPMAALLDYLAEQVKDYEDRAYKIPDAEPHKVLKYLIEAHGLKQTEIEGVPQSMVSAILAGKRSISKDIAKSLASQFNVNVAVFL